ncbi:DivIVA domain-containing protein [Arthrobacter roseus]|uniref:DivIVA domain-containing protein n=1 Tax=Arthrobacter roseus TaxID=136274 RepID=UPI001965FF47|nr:DivIVA domain-containing protein [Arthrobacter roseus]MBM7848343.1 DivIVA domain-containing protein [Arthrobacter roseus]
MALTPEDVVNKRFQPTKFREGYDQDEVDDFLDEIVVELRRLTQENDDLRRKLAEASSSTSANAAVPAPVAATKTEQVQEESKPEPVKATEPKPEPKVAESARQPAQVNTADSAKSAAGVLAMAQKLHDDYVNTGIEQRDKIIAEAQIEASSLVNDAQEKSRKTLGALEQQKAVLERKVEQLRGFERDYRSRLKSYIEGQLRDLDARGSVASDTGES